MLFVSHAGEWARSDQQLVLFEYCFFAIVVLLELIEHMNDWLVSESLLVSNDQSGMEKLTELDWIRSDLSEEHCVQNFHGDARE